MMKFQSKNIVVALAATAVATLPAAAQGLSKEITIDKDVVPQERAASRLPVLPSLIEVKPEGTELQFSFSGIPARLAPYAGWLAPARVGDAVSVSDWRGYVEAGYFPAYNATLSAGYRALDNGTDRLNVWGHFSGSSWRNPDGDLPKDMRPKYNDSGAALGAAYQRRFNPFSTLDVALTLGGNWYNPPFDFYSQSVYTGKLDAAWRSRGGMVDYRVALHGDIFKMQKDWGWIPIGAPAASEQTFTLDGDMSVPFGGDVTSKSALTFDYAATFLHRNLSLRMNEAGMEQKKGHVAGLVTLTPGMKFAGDNYQVNIGARVDLSFNSGGGTFHIAPKIEAVGAPSRYFRIFATATGGQVTNSASDLFGELRYIDPSLSYAFSQVAIDADAGFIVGPWRGFQLTVFGGYSRANDWVMPYHGAGRLSPVDIKGFRFGGSLRYDWRDIVTVEGSGAMAPQGYDKGYYMWRDRAKMELRGMITVRPIKALSVNVGGVARLKRRYYYPAYYDYPGNYLPLGSIADLTAGADYRFTPQFSVFLKGTNLLNHNWSEAIATDVPCHGRTALVGVTYLF